ncbi:hypothetical protein AU255_11745 [Methyloprofundus sedimenti]|uniref:Uncharacterized protein n=1 Tax=Methyloprofundus sedimenti TaxID=1420851 RepID=A0A1V8MA70_9GAMM|nr:hypothetical protein [Methyloprofundus sedimenti]OQK18455.1 hypothetical protein AU255_11745 [Methyloprofundus sedimenti]
MKKLLISVVIILICLFFFLAPVNQEISSNYDVYQYVKECKAELGITRKLPLLSCLDGEQIPIFVDKHEIQRDNWDELSSAKKCDNPHWLGGDMGCWTYSHIQVLQLDNENVMVLNCRQKGNQLNKTWFRKTKTNLGMNQQQRKEQYDNAHGAEKTELYYLYNTFNDIGVILRNTHTGKSCYLTQYGDAVTGFLPPLDAQLPGKSDYLNKYNPDQARPPKDFPEELWYRNANQAFKSPGFTANAGCIDCHNAHGFKYSPYINSKQGLPRIQAMSKLPMLPVGKPFIDRFRDADFLQVTTEAIDGMPQLCTQCHNMTTSGTCGDSIDFATGRPSTTLHTWLTRSTSSKWMPPLIMDSALIKKHVATMKCCCNNPDAKGCKTRKFGPTLADLPKDFSKGEGWVSGQGANLCKGTMNSIQWNADKVE